ncbi:hypothetical protein IIB34_02505, partial [PVC group bacterium]|nr:hypothetical protein [PVC group bacterium]
KAPKSEEPKAEDAPKAEEPKKEEEPKAGDPSKGEEPKKEEAAKDESQKENSGEEKPKETAIESTLEGGDGKKKKINKLTSEEIDARLKMTKEKMGGDASSYARALLIRKEELK